MSDRLLRVVLVGILWCLTCAVCAAAVAETDSASGLIVDEGWQLARAHCGGCHSYRLVTSQRGDASYWQDTIDWMQRTQNLWPIEAQQRAALVDYLARNYNETSWGRRPALAPGLLPPSRPVN